MIKPYELDGYSSVLGVAFEYHGVQHYKFLKYFHKTYDQFLQRQEVDHKKEEICASLGIRLIAIPYTTSQTDDDLIQYIKEQLTHLTIPLVIDKVDLSSFYEGLKPLIKLREMAQQHGGECLATFYINNKTKVLWRCKLGHEWQAKPNDITNGQWCGTCAGNQPLTIEEMHEIAQKRNGLCLSVDYLNGRTPLLWRCEQGHQWKAAGSDVKSGKWCRKWATKRRTEARKDTIEEMHVHNLDEAAAAIGSFIALTGIIFQ